LVPIVAAYGPTTAAPICEHLFVPPNPPDRKLDAWETNAAAPFITMERARGTVAISALGGDRFQVDAPGHQEIVVGFSAASERADELARELD